jgi:hypothetical protein
MARNFSVLNATDAGSLYADIDNQFAAILQQYGHGLVDAEGEESKGHAFSGYRMFVDLDGSTAFFKAVSDGIWHVVRSGKWGLAAYLSWDHIYQARHGPVLDAGQELVAGEPVWRKETVAHGLLTHALDSADAELREIGMLCMLTSLFVGLPDYTLQAGGWGD